VPEETVIFLHVPKTAGTSLHWIIDRQYPRRSDYWLTRDNLDLDKLKGMSTARRAEIRMLRGHFWYGVHEYIPRPTTYFTVLREPIDRVISFYYNKRRLRQYPDRDAILAQEMSLQAYVQSRVTLQTNNFATRMISGSWGTPEQRCDEETLAQAKKNLAERFAVVGLTERFDETILLLKRRFGWRNVFYLRHNVNPLRPELASIPGEVLGLLREHNQLDLELYAFAKELFKRQVGVQGNEFAREVQRFRVMNRYVQPGLWVWESARKVSVRVWLRAVWKYLKL
jgi:hypothetical protein